MDGFVFLSYSVNWYPLGFVSVQLANAISGPFLDGGIVPYIFSFSKALSSGFILTGFPTPGDQGSLQTFMLPVAAENSRQILAHLELFLMIKWAVISLSNKGYNLYPFSFMNLHLVL